MKWTRRALLASVAALGLLGAADPARAFLASSQNSQASNLLTTLTLAETTGSTVPANFIPPMFGHPFKKGDITTGTYPKFETTGGANIPFTMFNAVYWSDGSLKFASFLIRPPIGISANSSITINIKSGGSAPGSSLRGTSDLTAGGLDLKLEITGQENLSGTWTSILANGIANTNQSFSSGGPDIISYTDGAVGRVFRIRASFEQSGAAHGQMECYWYCAVLQDSGGGLYGIRFLGRATQPWYNNDTPTKTYRAFNAFNLKNGASTIRDCMAGFQGAGSAQTVTYAGSADQLQVASTAVFEAGTLLQFTTTGTLPTGLSTGTSYFVGQNGQTATKFKVYTGANGAVAGSNIAITGAGSGTHTVTAYPYICHAGSLWTCGTGATWDYVQGAGSIATDATVRVQMTKTYWRSTKLVASYNFGISPTSNTTTQYFLNTHGPVSPDTSAVGEREDIGLLPAWLARHLFTQAAVDELNVRVVGMVGGTFSTCLKDTTTKSCPVVNNTNYSGMPTKNNSFRWTGTAGSTSGFTQPNNTGTMRQGWNGQDTTHMPSTTYYPYLFTGEPQFFDLLTEWANNAVLNRGAQTTPVAAVSGITNTLGVPRNPTISSVAYSGATIGDSTLRQDAWAVRDVSAMLAVCPATHPENASYKSYFTDLAAATWSVCIAFNAIQTAFWLANGIWVFASDVMDSWMHGYFIQANAFAYGATEQANALTVLNHVVKFPAYVKNTFGDWHVSTYQECVRSIDGSTSAPIITSDDGFGVYGMSLQWTSGNDTFTLTPFLNYSLTAGDKVLFNTENGSAVPGGFSALTPYYVVSPSGNTCKLAATPGGAPITPSTTAAAPKSVYFIWTTPTSTNGAGLQSPTDYAANIRGALNYASSVGATVDAATISGLDSRISNAGISFTSDPKYYMQAAA